jgi:hypothetical protein
MYEVGHTLPRGLQRSNIHHCYSASIYKLKTKMAGFPVQVMRVRLPGRIEYLSVFDVSFSSARHFTLVTIPKLKQVNDFNMNEICK